MDGAVVAGVMNGCELCGQMKQIGLPLYVLPPDGGELPSAPFRQNKHEDLHKLILSSFFIFRWREGF